MDVFVLRGIVQHGVKMNLIDLGHAADIARQRACHLDQSLALQHEQMPDLERLASISDIELAVTRNRALVDAEQAHFPDVGIDRHLEDMGQHMFARVRFDMHQHRFGALSIHKIRGIAFTRMRQQLDDHVEQFRDAGAAARRDKTHRDQMPFAQRLLQRRMQFADINVTFFQVALDKRSIDLDHLLDEGAMRRLHRAKIRMALALVETVHHPGAASSRQVQRQTLLAKGGLDLRQQPRQIDPLGVYLVDDDDAIQLPRCGVIHHALGHRLDAVGRVDDNGGGLDRLQRGQGRTEKIRVARRIDQMDAAVAPLDVQQRGVQ